MLFKIPTEHCRLWVIPELRLRLLLYYLPFFRPLPQTDWSSDISFLIYSKQNMCVCPSYSFPLSIYPAHLVYSVDSGVATPALTHFSNVLAYAIKKKKKSIFQQFDSFAKQWKIVKQMTCLFLHWQQRMLWKSVNFLPVQLPWADLRLSSFQHLPWYRLSCWRVDLTVSPPAVKPAQLRDKNPTWISKERLNI